MSTQKKNIQKGYFPIVGKKIIIIGKNGDILLCYLCDVTNYYYYKLYSRHNFEFFSRCPLSMRQYVNKNLCKNFGQFGQKLEVATEL